MTEESPKFVDLSEDDFPFTIECFDAADGRLIWSEVIREPGALQIQGQGKACSVKVSWPDGEVRWSHPDE